MDAIGRDPVDPTPDADRTFEPDERGRDAITARLARRRLAVVDAGRGGAGLLS